MPQKIFKLYVWTGLGYFLLWLAIDLCSQHPPFLATLFNSIWFAIYITIINFLFFERVRGRIFFYPVAIISLSAGLYAWRMLGVSLYLYTALKSFSITAGIIYVAPHGILSLLFFGLIKNQYEHKKLKQAVEQFQLEKKMPGNDHIVITVQKKKVKLFFSEIFYVESQREYVKIVTAKAAYLPKMSTLAIEKLLPAHQFKRVHRSFIISLNHIDSYTAETVQVAGHIITIGRAYREIFKQLQLKSGTP